MDIKNAIGNLISSNFGNLKIIEFLGKGKSGYSYLAQYLDKQYVVKLMHDEPCEYYSFGSQNKVELEVSAYDTLKKAGITIPKLLDFDIDKNYLIKEYIDGDLVTELIVNDLLPYSAVEQVCGISEILKSLDLNIDYFPDNFVFHNKILYYIDYEYNPYDPKWDLANWGLYYWANVTGMKAYKETKDLLQINQSANSGLPIKQPYKEIVNFWLLANNGSFI